MKFVDIKNMTFEELVRKKKSMKEDLFEVKMKHSLGQLNNPLEIRAKRRDIARVNTALHQKMK
ncbi:MAG: 50S ribosomal protein L29 [Bdellovibrionales bacterium]|nr:50S ribosomal protein L29 [Bdellovibrionales bacterium]